MATDKLFYEYAIRFPNALAKLIGAEPGEYEARSITLKQTEKRADVFLISRSGTYVALVETQGYDDPFLYHRMLAALTLFCLQNGYKSEIGAAVIFLEDSHYRAATAFFKRQFAGTGVLKFSPKTIVLSRLKTDELRKVDDIFLKPFFPLCDISPEEIERRAPEWAKEIRVAPGLKKDARKSLLGLLGGFISHKIRVLNEETLNNLLGGFKMEEVPVIEEIVQRKIRQFQQESQKNLQQKLRTGMRKGMRKGIHKGMRHTILKQIAARFGKVPKELKIKIQMLDDTDELDRIATALLTIQNLDEIDDMLN
jgi:predicted transposase YdaD